MWKAIKAVLPHLSTGISILAIVGAAGAYVVNAYAEGVVKSLVNDRIATLEQIVQDIKLRDQIQTEKLGTIQSYQVEQREETKELRQDIKAILFELKR